MPDSVAAQMREVMAALADRLVPALQRRGLTGAGMSTPCSATTSSPSGVLGRRLARDGLVPLGGDHFRDVGDALL